MSEELDVRINGIRYVPASEEPDPGETPHEKEFNSAAFFDYVREHLFRGSLNQAQVDGLNHLGRYLKGAFPDDPVGVQKAAYCLATFQWETASTMQPIEEYGGRSARYAPWYGRGYVQLTWEENYLKQENKLAGMKYVQDGGIPYQVHRNRDLALHLDTSAIISIWGMIDGDFTGKKLSDYIKEESVDYVNARRIVNGTDRAQEIADMAMHYENAIGAGLGEAV